MTSIKAFLPKIISMAINVLRKVTPGEESSVRSTDKGRKMNTGTSLESDLEKAKRSSKINLELLSGPMDGLEFEIKKDSVTIGRDQNKDIPLPLDSMISRAHARITYENGEYWLEDLGSTNGTFIGEKRVNSKGRLPVRAIFRAGASEMRLRGSKL